MNDVEQLEKPKSKYTNRGGHGGPLGNQKGLKHGYYSLVRFIKQRGGSLDRRSILGKMLTETEHQLEADLGGDLLSVRAEFILSTVYGRNCIKKGFLLQYLPGKSVIMTDLVPPHPMQGKYCTIVIENRNS